MENVSTSSTGNAFISNNITGAILAGAGQQNTSLYFAGANAEALTRKDAPSAFTNFVPTNLATPLTYSQPAIVPQALTTTGGISASFASGVAVQNLANWPVTGIALIDSEYVGYSTTNPLKLVIERRGLCGSTPTAHSQYALVFNMGAVLGCAPGATPQLTLDNTTGNVTFNQLASYGDVYMSLNGSSTLQLCPYKGNLLTINNVPRRLAKCLFLPQASATSSSRNYVYATFETGYVSTSVASGTGTSLHFTAAPNNFQSGAPITCWLYNGTTTITMVTLTDDNTTTLSGHNVIVADLPFSTASTGPCTWMALHFDTIGHAPAPNNGMEVWYNATTTAFDTTETLVGMVYAGTGPAIIDTPAKRDVASWFNRHWKTCQTKITSTSWTDTPGDASWHEVANGSSNLECEFVTWNIDDLPWTAFGGASDATINSIVSTSVGFDTTSATENVSQATSTTRLNVAVSGSKNGVTEDRHSITLLYAISNGATVGASVNYFSGAGLSLRLPQ